METIMRKIAFILLFIIGIVVVKPKLYSLDGHWNDPRQAYVTVFTGHGSYFNVGYEYYLTKNKRLSVHPYLSWHPKWLNQKADVLAQNYFLNFYFISRPHLNWQMGLYAGVSSYISFGHQPFAFPAYCFGFGMNLFKRAFIQLGTQLYNGSYPTQGDTQYGTFSLAAGVRI